MESQEKSDKLFRLPDKHWVRIMQNLSPMDLSVAAMACTRFRKLAVDVFKANYRNHNVDLDVRSLMEHWGSRVHRRVQRLLKLFGPSMTFARIKLTLDTDDPNGARLNMDLLNHVLHYCCGTLERLWLENVNSMHHSLVDWVPLVQNLTHLELYNCSISDTVLLSQCDALTNLTIDATAIEAVAECVFIKLSVLVLRSPYSLTKNPLEFRQRINEFLLNHAHVRCLTVAAMTVNLIADSIRYLDEVVELNVIDSCGSIRPITKMTNIKRFALHRHAMQADETKYFLMRSRSVGMLTSLDLIDVDPGKDLDFLGHLHRYQNLSVLKMVAGTWMSDANLSALHGLQELTHLVIRQATFISWTGLLELVSHLPRLQRLSIIQNGCSIDEHMYRLFCQVYSTRTWTLFITNFEDCIDLTKGRQRRIRFTNDEEDTFSVQVFEA